MEQPGQQRNLLDSDDEEDAELQRALALSLKDHHQPTVTFGQVNIAGQDDEDEALKQALALSLQCEQDKSQKAEVYAPSDTQCVSEAPLSWKGESATTSVSALTKSSQLTSTTEGEQADIWLPEQLPPIVLDMEAIDACYSKAEPFDIESFHSIMWDENLTTESDKNRWLGQGINVRGEENESIVQESPEHAGDDEMSRLNLLAKSHVPWGLVQQHGGPCGVLAALQAEMLRFMIWGPLPSAPYLSGDALLEALARAMGTILARAALTEAVEGSSDSDMKNNEGADSCSYDETEVAVRLVLPSSDGSGIDRPQTWEDFGPWQNSTTSLVPDDSLAVHSASKSPSSFTTYTVSSTLSSVASGRDAVYKRQKINNYEDKSLSQQKEEQEILLLNEIDRLARHVAAFLLQAPTGGFPPIYHFRHAGGVLLLVMSLIASRTPGKLRDEFDDPVGTRLTGQFGHCSQELINLLLTGRAVSNVFDNILKPSGDMVCRGICSKPAVGYLTQLEALQYCSVGSFYKSPRVPVWIIASTSHFSVLFGPKKAIQESSSDMLLEKCRRAFKSVEGAALDYDLDAPKLSALSAVLEVTGAGIILWDDFWKTVSRLMTGAAIEAVLEGQVASDKRPLSHPGMAFVDQQHITCPPSPLETTADQSAIQSDNLATFTTSNNEAAMNTIKPDQIETDEEMARRLANEWGSEDASSVNAVNGGSPVNFPFTHEDDDGAKSVPNTEDSKPAAKGSASVALTTTFDFETYGNTFSLFHYNGLRGGVLTPFRVTRLTPEEAVGASIALSRANNSSAHSTDLEEVIRTKWPSCVFNFLGKPPPLID